MNNPFPNDPNGVLWTLPTEFLCYILCFAAFKITFFDRKKIAWLSIPCLAAALIYFSVLHLALLSVIRAILLFAIGVLFYVYRDKIVLKSSWGFASVGVFIALVALKLDIIAMLLVFPYMMAFLGWGTKRKFSTFAKHGEFSYGIFLWGWPVQQTLVYLWPTAMFPIQNAVLALCIALVLGILNDLLIDKPIKRWRKNHSVK